MNDLIERTEAAIGLAKLAGQNRMCHVSLTYLTEVITALREQEAEIAILSNNLEAEELCRAEITEFVTEKLEPQIAEQQARIEQYEQVLEKVRDGTWWDGTEPWRIDRIESWIKAELARIPDE